MRVASFDVFDTLLTRAFARPADVFGCVGERLGRDDFAAERVAAERAARARAPRREVTLATIYSGLAARLHWNEAERDAAMEQELAIEAQHVHAVEPMRAVVAAARREADRIVFLSDMYLPGAIIASWLRRENFFQDGDRLCVSCEHGGGKGSGLLFEKVRAELGASFAEWIHYGDHPWSDVKKPRSLGIDARPVTFAVLRPRERAILRGPPAAGTKTGLSLLAGIMRCARLARAEEPGREQVLQEIASGVAGPLFFGFVSWCLDEAARRGVRRLYFLSRGGQVLLRIAREIARARPIAVECRYLCASRLAFNAPSLSDHPGRRPPFTAAPAASAGLARDYLAAEGISAGEPVALVDLGWMGSIQAAIERLIGRPGAPAPLTGFYLGLVEQAALRPAGETLGYTNKFGRLPLRRETSHLVLIELLAQADHGPVAGFERHAGGTIAPVFDPIGPVAIDEVRLLQDGVLRFARLFLSTAARFLPVEPGWAGAAIGAYREFHRQPAEKEALVFGRMPHSDQLKETVFTQLAPAFGPADVLMAMISRTRRPPCWWIEGQAALGSAPALWSYAKLRWLKWRAQTALTGLRD